MASIESLLALPAFQNRSTSAFATKQEISNAYAQARLLCQHYQMSYQDIITLSPKFWSFYTLPLHTRHTAAFVLLITQYNLCIGTLAPYAQNRADLKHLIADLLKYDIAGQFMLTEVGHGLDIGNLETTATLAADGGFEIHSPSSAAAKYMPPTADAGVRRGAIVFARLVVEGKDRGIRAFWVMLSDDKGAVAEGVTSFALPKLPGSAPVDHAVTFFTRMRVPASALLGPLETKKDPRLIFLSLVERISVGTLSLSMVNIQVLRASAYVAGKYSMRRTVQGANGQRTPIIQFRTQQRPILHALAQAAVFEAGGKACIDIFTSKDAAVDKKVKQAVGGAFKAAVSGVTQDTLAQMAERCGCQGLYEDNLITASQLAARGNTTAEGDVVVLCIRLATELLSNKYKLPPSRHPLTLLAKYETGLFTEARAVIASLKGGPRSTEFNNRVLPLCLPLVEAIGYRLCYEAALDGKVLGDLTNLFEAGIVTRYPGWFIENLKMTRAEIFAREERALSTVLPLLDVMLDGLGVAPYAQVPILSDELWDEYVLSLPRSGDTLLPNEVNGLSHVERAMLRKRGAADAMAKL